MNGTHILKGIRRRPDLLVIGPSAPPHNGMTLATELVGKATEGHFTHVRLDTADRRGLANIGRLDFGNVAFALRDGAKFLWMLATKKPRVVYVPISQASLPFLRDCLFLIPARLTHRNVIVHLHGSAFGKFYRASNPVTRCLIRFAIGKVDFAIVLGKSVEGVFDGIIGPEHIQIVPNGIPDYFDNRKPHNNSSLPPVILFLGTLLAEKGFLDVLRALPHVRSSVPDMRAVFAGEWYSQQDKNTAYEIVEKFGLTQNVEFVGPVGPERKQELLSSADLFVFPSANEGQPYVILEAMSAGLPVISTKVGCIPEMVHDGLNGFLIEPGDTKMLAERIKMLLGDVVLRERMAASSREKFLREFTFQVFAKKIGQVFSEVMSGESRRSRVAAALND